MGKGLDAAGGRGTGSPDTDPPWPEMDEAIADKAHYHHLQAMGNFKILFKLAV